MVEAKQEIGSDYDAADAHAGKLPKSHTPAVEHLDLPESTLELMFYVCDSIIDPLIQPAHFELSNAIKEVLQNFKSPRSQTDVAEPDFVDLAGESQRFVHHKASDGYAKK